MRFARSVVSALLLTAVRSAAAFAAASSRRPNTKLSGGIATSTIRTTTSSLVHHSDTTTCSQALSSIRNRIAKRSKICHASLFSSSPGHAIIPRGGGLASAYSSFSSTALHSTASTTEATDTITTTTPPIEIFRQDYRPLRYTVSEVSLDFDLHPNRTIVTNRMILSEPPRSDNDDDAEDVYILDGDASAVQLLDIQIDGRSLQAGTDFVLDPSGHVGLKLLRASSTLRDGSHVSITTEIIPETNTQLSGLYVSDGVYCTQCEAMGFRRITYYPDRPDNMAIFKEVKIQADKHAYPLLLSNGNLIEQGDIQADDDTSSSTSKRHYAVWSDPFPKPSYLFAMVAGNLGVLEDTYTTISGKTVQLKIYSEPHNVHQLSYAMESLKDAMRWDEKTYGLEYDLDIYNVVAVDNFNMGAMENKSLNVFNTAYVLADPKTATDGDYERVQAVIGHEYFHNWTGNRVTCRTYLWFAARRCIRLR
jgi:aminopeptidase N